MRPDRLLRAARAGACLLAASAIFCGCAAPRPPQSDPVPVADTSPKQAPREAAPEARVEAPQPERAAPPVVEQALAYADRVRSMATAELNQELERMGDGGNTSLGLMRLALALAQARGNGNNARAQMVLQRLLGRTDESARALHPLARLLSAQLAESRRSDEQLDRQAQLLRDAQRRIDQLNERLEAVRAIERSLPSRPASAPPAPAHPPERKP